MIRGLLNFLAVAKATLVDDSKAVQFVQTTEAATGNGGFDRVTDQVPRMAEYGFASNLPDGCEVLVVRRNGDRGNGVVVATQHRDSRPTGLQPGEVWHYDVWGHAVKFTADGIVVDGAGDVVTVTNASKVRCECDIETTGDVIARCDGVAVSLGKLRDAYDVHDHPPVAGAGTWGAGPPNEQV